MNTKIMSATALFAAIVVTMPVMAQDGAYQAYIGPSVEVTGAVGDVSRDVQYGAAIGLNGLVAKNVIVGVDANVQDVFNHDRQIGAGLRLGTVQYNTLFYGRVGYTNFRQVGTKNLDGLQLGAGIERQVYGPTFIRAEYRFTNVGGDSDRHTGLLGVGVRF